MSLTDLFEKLHQKYKKFMEQYNKDHRLCPKCGSEKHTETYVGYVSNHDNPEDYKDKNYCECLNCGDVHIKHDRVKSFEEK